MSYTAHLQDPSVEALMGVRALGEEGGGRRPAVPCGGGRQSVCVDLGLVGCVSPPGVGQAGVVCYLAEIGVPAWDSQPLDFRV